MSPQIIVIKPKSMSSADRAKLTRAGNTVVEHANPLEIIYRQPEEHLPYRHIPCANCGERIYLLKERLDALQVNGVNFYCSHGHTNRYTKK